MGNMMRGKLEKGLVGLIIVLAVVWAAIGADWRRLILNPITNKDVLFWSDAQRDAAFRMMDRVGFITKARIIEKGDKVRTLPAGSPLPVGVDIDAYMTLNHVAGLVIVQNGKIRHEQYGLDFNAEGRWTSFSVAKSFTSTLVGAAIKDGYIDSLDANVADYIKGLKGSAYDGVTIEQLLTMSSGVAWNEDYSDPQSDVARFIETKSEDGLNPIVTYMRKLPRAHPPGTVWNYSTGETNMISLLVREATGKRLTDYIRDKIWQAYGMEANGSWLLDEDGEELGGCCIQATTRDFARMGQFMLDGAKVDGVSIVPDGWIEEATRAHFDLDKRGYGYGYQWWTYEDGTFGGRGIFGQSIFVDPKRQLVIATNSNWADAVGNKLGQNKRRDDFHRAIINLIDGEGK